MNNYEIKLYTSPEQFFLIDFKETQESTLEGLLQDLTSLRGYRTLVNKVNNADIRVKLPIIVAFEIRSLKIEDL